MSEPVQPLRPGELDPEAVSALPSVQDAMLPSPQIARRLRLAAGVGGILVMILGVVVMLGWAIGSDALTRVLPRANTMKFTTAFCFALLGAGIALPVFRTSDRVRSVALMLGGAVSLIGALVVVQVVCRWDFGIDNPFGFDPIPVHPGRMSLLTAIAFVALGLALLLHELHRVTWAQALALVGLGIGLLATLGHIFDVEGMYRYGDNSVAVHTAPGLFLAALSILCLRADRGPMSLLAGRNVGSSMARSLLPLVFVLPPLGIGVLLRLVERGSLGVQQAMALTAIGVILVASVALWVQAQRLRHLEAREHAVAEALTRVRVVEAELRRSQHELTAANADLDSFAAMAAHDLRRPLTVVRGYAELIQDEVGEQSPTFALARRIEDAALRGDALIHDLLAYARAGTSVPTLTRVDLTALAHEVLAEVRGAHPDEAAAATLTVGELPTVDGDPTLLRQVLTNLVANALRYGRPDGPVEVVIDATTDAHGIPTVSVSDNGRGIPREEWARIFEMFRRGSTSVGRSGTGVGLAICRRLVERHGGRIRVDQGPAGGARFSFTVPPPKPDAVLEP